MGSIPSAIWIGKTFYKTDVRQHGSKNAGATNTFRVLGKFPGTVVLLLDILKGFLAVSFVPRIFPVGIEFEGLYIVILSLIVIMGHMFSVFSKFKGGKGVATTLGVIVALNPPTAGVVFAIFFVVFAISHYVSLGAIIASLSFPFVLRFLFGISDIYLNIFAIFTINAKYFFIIA